MRFFGVPFALICISDHGLSVIIKESIVGDRGLEGCWTLQGTTVDVLFNLAASRCCSEVNLGRAIEMKLFQFVLPLLCGVQQFLTEIGRGANLAVINSLVCLLLIKIQQLLGGISKKLFPPFDREVINLILLGNLTLLRLRDATWPDLVIVQ